MTAPKQIFVVVLLWVLALAPQPAAAAEGLSRTEGIRPGYTADPGIEGLVSGRDSVRDFALGLIR